MQQIHNPTAIMIARTAISGDGTYETILTLN
jgi:hypothetical protein